MHRNELFVHCVVNSVRTSDLQKYAGHRAVCAAHKFGTDKPVFVLLPDELSRIVGAREDALRVQVDLRLSARLATHTVSHGFAKKQF
jgi:hypothetical protein